MRITPHFSLAEFAQPARHGLPRIDYPPEWRETRLRELAELLEVIHGRVQAYLGSWPIRLHVLSAYRSLAYNRAIGSRDTSQHVQGRAADIAVEYFAVAAGRHEGKWYPLTVSSLHELILTLHADGTLRDRPTRLGGLGLYERGGFTHVDTRPGKRLARWAGRRVIS